MRGCNCNGVGRRIDDGEDGNDVHLEGDRNRAGGARKDAEGADDDDDAAAAGRKLSVTFLV